MRQLNRVSALLLVTVMLIAIVPTRLVSATGVEMPERTRWIAVQGPTSLPLHSVDMVNADEGWAVGSSGIILHFTNGEWKEIPRPTTDYLTGISMLDANSGWAVGSDAVLRYSNGQWQPYPHPSPIFPEAVSTVSITDAWILEGHRVLSFTGAEWQLPQTLGDVQRMMDLTMLDAKTGWAVGFGGIIMRYDGTEWTRTESPTADRLYSVSFSGAQGWAVGGEYPRLGVSRGTVLHYVNGKWDTVPVPDISALTSVATAADGSAWAMSPEGMAVRLQADGSYQVYRIPRGINSVDLVSDSEGWAVGDNGLILHLAAQALPTESAPPPSTTRSDQVYFPQTGHYLSYGFLSYWKENGGLPVFGYPITEELTERNPLPPAGDGQEYTVQYFERARFEYHPENKGTPFETQLGLLGQNAIAGKFGPEYTPPLKNGDAVPPDSPDRRYFAPQSFFPLAYGFKTYWEKNGGLAIFGYPISNEFTEVNPEDGKSYTVQYFERARFEYHPEFRGTPFEVELGLLGKNVLRERGWIE